MKAVLSCLRLRWLPPSENRLLGSSVHQMKQGRIQRTGGVDASYSTSRFSACWSSKTSPSSTCSSISSGSRTASSCGFSSVKGDYVLESARL